MTRSVVTTPYSLDGQPGRLDIELDVAVAAVQFVPDVVEPPPPPSSSTTSVPATVKAVQTATGGAGGPVMVVDTLALDGPTSLKNALTVAKGPRIIRFAPQLKGVIELPDHLNVQQPDGGNFTLEWSPKVALKGSPIRLTAVENFIIRGLISLPGDGIGRTREDRDCLQFLGDCRNGLTEGGLYLWPIDECVSFWHIADKAPHNIEFRYNISGEGLRKAGHPKGEHGYNMLVGYGCRDIAIHHNLMINSMRRHPAIQGDSNIQVFNNLIAGWSQAATRMVEDGPVIPARHAVIVSNVYDRLGQPKGEFANAPISLENIDNPGMVLEIEGNKWSDGTSADALTKSGGLPDMASVTKLTTVLGASRQTDHQAIIDDVLAKAGPIGDYHRERLVAQFKSGVGKIINSQNEVGGYTAYTA